MVSSGLLRRMALVGSSETSVRSSATRCNNPEDTILHSHRHENLKSYTIWNIIKEINIFSIKIKKNIMAAMHYPAASPDLTIMQDLCPNRTQIFKILSCSQKEIILNLPTWCSGARFSEFFLLQFHPAFVSYSSITIPQVCSPCPGSIYPIF
jgi:hypothetical protein